MTDKERIQYRLLSEPDFIDLKRFDYSIAEALARYPDGLPDRLIAQGLGISEDEVAAIYLKVVRDLRSLMMVDEEKDD
jgi:hypothetical protein